MCFVSFNYDLTPHLHVGRNTIAVRVDDSAEEVAAVLSKYNLLSVPVVDDEFRMQGLVTVDDVLDAVLPQSVKRKLPRATH